jgi:D-arginine utilization repressor
MNKELKKHAGVAQAISMLLHPHAEVVLHDLSTGSIAAIYNNLSKRKIGEESLIEEIVGLDTLPDVFHPYSKINWDGKKMKSVTATLRDAKGIPIGLFCINLDLSKWEEMHQFILGWIGGIDTQEQPDVLFKNDWKEKINVFVSDYLQKEGLSLKSITKEQKQELVRTLHRKGAFQAKNAASYTAEILELSRATIYNYLR